MESQDKLTKQMGYKSGMLNSKEERKPLAAMCL